MKPLYVKKNGVVYRVSGTGIPSIYPAANVEYDNTVTSELQATDVQDAIDELSTRQGGVQSDWDEDDTTELSYIQNKPNLGTAAFKDVPASGDAGFTQVVLGKDTRLTYYDRNRYDASVKCSTNIVEGNIIVGLNGLYHHLNDGTVFDITYPILYAKNNMGAGAANSNNYDSLAIDITITQQMTLTQFLPVYIKGRLSGNMFNPISTTPLTQEMVQDGYHYMLLGLASTSTKIYLFHDHRIFANNGGSFCEIVGNLGTAAYKDIPLSGNASIYQVVTGGDTRLSDARPASDVSAWAKESTKPTYTASEVGAIATTAKGTANGVAELDSAGKVPSSQLPSFVDDVIEVADYDHLPITGESGKIYVTLDTNKTYRWTGSGYAEISESLALGETSSTAYRGDRGKTAYDHATETKLSTATASGLYKVAATAQGHVASLTAVEKSDITALGIPGSDTNDKVTQTNSSTDGNYRILLSGGNNDTTETTTSNKSSKFTANPSTGLLTVNKVKATINNSVLTGTGTAAQDKGSGVSPRYFPAKWQFNTGYNPSEGDIITITLPVAGHGWGDWISINNGSTWHPANFQGTTRLTTHFGAGQVIQFIFDADGQTNSMTPVTGADSVNGSNITGGCWRVINMYDSNTDIRPSAYCDTAAATAAKAASCTNYNLLDKSYLHVTMVYANTSASAITLNVNGKGAKAIYINGAASSASNYTLPAGTYLVYYASNIYYFRTDGKITGDITGNAATVNGLTVQTAVPANALFTDHTYNFGGTTFYSGNSGSAEHNANSIQYNGVYYYTSNGPGTDIGATTADGGLYAEFHSTTWGGQIAQDYRDGDLFVRGKNNGTLQQWKKILCYEDAAGFIYTPVTNFKFEPQQRKIITVKSTSAWDSQVYSRHGYTDNVYVTFKPAQTNMAIMIGLDSNPAQDANYTNIDYCWYIQNNGNVGLYESGSSISSYGTYAVGDEFRIEYSGGKVRYYMNGALKREVARAYNKSTKLYMDSSMHGASSTLYDVDFGQFAYNATTVNGLTLSLVT